MIKDFYSKDEVIQLLVNERQRAVDIAHSYKEHFDTEYNSKLKAGYDLAFISKKIANECRLIGNSISRLTALSLPLNETKKDLIINELNK